MGQPLKADDAGQQKPFDLGKFLKKRPVTEPLADEVDALADEHSEKDYTSTEEMRRQING